MLNGCGRCTKLRFLCFQQQRKNRLHDTLPLDRKEKQRGVAYLEAVGRTMIGIAPWLELSLPRSTSEEERALQKQIPGFRPQSARQHL